MLINYNRVAFVCVHSLQIPKKPFLFNYRKRTCNTINRYSRSKYLK